MTRERFDEFFARHAATLDGDLQDAPLDRANLRDLLLHVCAQPVDGARGEANRREFALNLATRALERRRRNRVLELRGADLLELFAHSSEDRETVGRELLETRFVCDGRIGGFEIAVVVVRVGIARVRVGVSVLFGARVGCRCRYVRLLGVFVEAVDEFVDAQFTGGHLIGVPENRFDGRGTGGDCLDHLVQPVLDAFRDRDFTGTGQEFGRAHFAHVHAHGIGGAAEFGIDRGERDFRFLVGLFVRHHRGRCVIEQQRFCVRRLLVDRHAHVIERADNRFDSRRLREVVWQVIVDFGVGEVATLLAKLDQRAHLALTFLVLLRCIDGIDGYSVD
ncbi:hypothetical protein BGLT_00898 [Caballeronia glathei]|nr:hypothetical protein BGLT_00898 [Caballeronia glathei]